MQLFVCRCSMLKGLALQAMRNLYLTESSELADRMNLLKIMTQVRSSSQYDAATPLNVLLAARPNAEPTVMR